MARRLTWRFLLPYNPNSTLVSEAAPDVTASAPCGLGIFQSGSREPAVMLWLIPRAKPSGPVQTLSWNSRFITGFFANLSPSDPEHISDLSSFISLLPLLLPKQLLPLHKTGKLESDSRDFYRSGPLSAYLSGGKPARSSFP